MTGLERVRDALESEFADHLVADLDAHLKEDAEWKKQAHNDYAVVRAELARHGKGKCVPADEFERAKEPVFAEGMRAGCEDLMREAARMDDENEQLKENARRRQEQVEHLEAELARLRKQLEAANRVWKDEEAENARLREELETAEDEGYKLGWQQAMEQEHPPEETT